MRLHEAAMDYLGTPFRPRGRSKWGVDCSGLLVVACADSGKPLKDRTDYGREPWNDGMVESLDEQLDRAEPPIQVDDILLMRIPGRKYPQHLGIVAPYPGGGLGIIHARSEFHEVKFHFLDEAHCKLIVGIYRVR